MIKTMPIHICSLHALGYITTLHASMVLNPRNINEITDGVSITSCSQTEGCGAKSPTYTLSEQVLISQHRKPQQVAQDTTSYLE